MKRFFLFSTMCLLCFSAVEAQNIFQKAYFQTGQDVSLTKSVPTADGGYVAIGDIYDRATDNPDILVLKTDRDGTLEWSRKFGSDSSEYAVDLLATPDGGYLIAGTTGDFFSFRKSDFLVFKINGQGQFQWRQVFGAEDYDDAYALTSVGNRYVIAGTTASTITRDFSGGYLIYLDSLGNVDDSRIINSNIGLTSPNGFISADRFADGGAIFAGYTGRGFLFDPYFVRLNADGTVRWVKRWHGLAGSQLVTYVKTLPDGGFVATSTASNTAAGKDNFWVARVNSLGNVVWFKQYQSANYGRLNSIHLTSDSAIIAAGNYAVASRNGSDIFNPIHVKINLSNGNLIWAKTQGDTIFSSRGNHITTARRDAGLTVVGEKVLIINTDTLLAGAMTHVDANGNLVNCQVVTRNFTAVNMTVVDSVNYREDVGGSVYSLPFNNTSVNISTRQLCLTTPNEEARPSTNIEIYPNPTKRGQGLQVRTDASEGDILSVTLWDLMGRKIWEYQTKQTTFGIPPSVTAQQTGIYWLKVQQKAQVWVKKVLIE